VCSELGRLWKEPVMTYFEELPLDLDMSKGTYSDTQILGWYSKRGPSTYEVVMPTVVP
jgi:hypothetical protein